MGKGVMSRFPALNVEEREQISRSVAQGYSARDVGRRIGGKCDTHPFIRPTPPPMGGHGLTDRAGVHAAVRVTSLLTPKVGWTKTRTRCYDRGYPPGAVHR